MINWWNIIADDGFLSSTPNDAMIIAKAAATLFRAVKTCNQTR
jgi:hypothetical protein